MGYTLGMDLLLHDRAVMPLDRPRIMGVLNLTPDSFSDGGLYTNPAHAVRHGLTMASQGADIIDVGGESTRPGAARIDTVEQVGRVVLVIRALREQLDTQHPGVQISIDTTRVDVARAAVDAGATMLNDVSAGREDERMLGFAAESDLPIILMHMLGEPTTMQDEPTYKDVVAEVRGFLLARAKAALDAGVDRRRIVLDPGIGFGKTTEHNLTLLRSIGEFVATGYPVLIGASRKRFIQAVDAAGWPATGGATPGDSGPTSGSGEPTSGGGGLASGGGREGGTCAVTAHCVSAGVSLLRVHDVGPNRQAARLAWALRGV
jgi:dihydropteroate synthase